MSESLSLLSGGGSGGAGGGGGGVIGLFVFMGLWSTKLSFLLVVDSSLTGSRLMSNFSFDGPLQLFVHNFECFVSSKAVFGRGVLLHVSVKVSGYFSWRVMLEV